MGIPDGRPDPGSFEEVCRYLEAHFEHIVQETILLNITLLLDVKVEEVLEKARRGRAEKGGAFDLEAIRALAENRDEMKDALMYTLFYLLQREQ